MASDWIHCNACTTLPSQGVQFLFTSCGHIVCKKCESKTSANNTCPYCKKVAQFIEINRSLKPDIQILFRNPRDLAAEYMKNLGSVLDFQHSHRSRLIRSQHENQKKMVKFMSAAQGEVKKRMEAEKKALDENKGIKFELEKSKMHVQKLEALLATRELELERMRVSSSYRSPAPVLYQRSVPSTDSGIGDSGLSSLSFIDAMTSTPISRSPNKGGTESSARRRSRDRLKEIFKSVNGSIPSPIVRSDVLETPAMLGMNKKRSCSETGRRSHYYQEDVMEMGGGY